MDPVEKKDDVIENEPALNTEPNTQTPPDDEEQTDEEIAALADDVRKKLEEKKGEKKTYTQDQVDDLFKKFEKKMATKNQEDDDDYIDLLDPNAVKREFIRIGRLKDKEGVYKFVVGLKDINSDPYIDQEITVQNIENPTKRGELIPWSEFIFEDGTSMLYPYLAFMNRANGVWAEVVEKKQTDISEKFGTVDVKTVDENNEWDTKNTGKKVLAKAVKYKTVYVCKEIKTGKMLEISQDVVNKVEVPYSELKKFIEDNK